MHNRCKELAEKAIMEMTTLDHEPTCEEWANFKACMCGAAAGVELEKNHKVIEAMKKSEDEEKAMDAIEKMMGSGNMGYNNRRYSSGRYAPAGRGHIGYRPEMEDDEWIHEYNHNPDFERNARMGYQTGDHMPRFGENYESYKMAKRHYTEDQDPKEKRKMDSHIAGIFDDVEYMIMDAWKDINPEEKQKYKMKIQQMAQKIQQMA